MEVTKSIIKKSFMSLLVIMQALSFSVAGFTQIALADHLPEHECPAFTGTSSPTGSGSHTFAYNPETCLWENSYYSWSPVTKSYTAKYSQMPVYNPTTNAWEHTVWDYSPAAGAYVSRTVSTPATTTPSPTSTSSDPTDSSSSPKVSSSSLTPGGGEVTQATSSSTISGTGTGSNNEITNQNNTDIDADISNNVSVLNTVDSDATSGDSNAIGNTRVGDVSTGDADAIANILNMIQSSWDPNMGSILTFDADLYDDYFGDLMFDPSLILNTGTSSNNQIAHQDNTDLTINVSDDASIQNDITLNATSGDATANGNTDVGDVSTGDANAIANVVNMINSIITSGQSFIGSINLHGDLDGDILLPPSLLAQILGTGTGSNNTISSSNDSDLDIDASTNSSIANNTNLTSQSGDATADGNTDVASVGSGSAQTSLNEMNLVGQNASAKKGLLVFVNVLGSWVGLIFDSPTNAAIAGTGTDSSNSIESSSSTDADVNVDRNYNIVNNLNLNATSGDATANGNTTVGNVSTGNATTSANILNMINSSLSFEDWFGVLFINVFGSWKGSFGNDTANGNSTGNEGPISVSSPSTTKSSSNDTTSSASISVASVIPGSSTSSSVSSSVRTQTTTSSSSSSDIEDQDNQQNQSQSESIASTTLGSSLWPSVIAGTAALAILFGERLLAYIRRLFG